MASSTEDSARSVVIAERCLWLCCSSEMLFQERQRKWHQPEIGDQKEMAGKSRPAVLSQVRNMDTICCRLLLLSPVYRSEQFFQSDYSSSAYASFAGSTSLPDDAAPLVAGGLAALLIVVALLATGNIGAGSIQLPSAADLPSPPIGSIRL